MRGPRAVHYVKPGGQWVRYRAELKLAIPLQLKSMSNQRMHWTKISAISKAQKDVLKLWMPALLNVAGADSDFRARVTKVTITHFFRYGRPMDTDALAGAGKWVRDAFARWLGIDDGDPRVTWSYDQKKQRDIGIEVTLS